MDTGTLVIVTLIVVITVIAVGEYIRGKELDSINSEPFDDRWDDVSLKEYQKKVKKENEINDRSLDDYAS